MSTIKLKRSASTGSPANLGQGEVAYSYLSGTQNNGGDRLYIGTGTENAGNAANLDVIGGKYFTDMMDHVAGTLTASSALLVDSNKKINELFVDNLKIDGNTITSEDTNGNITLDPNGTGKVQINSNATITGDLHVEGTTTTVDSTTVQIADPQFELASTNNNDGSNGVTTDAVDFGTYGNYNSDPSGTNATAYSGWFRDASDSGKFKFYTGLTSEPTTTVNTAHASYGAATLVASAFEGTHTGNTTGDLTGDVKSTNGTKILENGSDGSDATFTGVASKATILETARTIGGVSFNGSANIDLAGVNTAGNQDTSGNAATASSAAILTTARTIGGVSFNGSADIDLAGVNTAGNQDTSGNAATATALATARAIALSGDVVGTANFDGTAGISISTTIQANSVALGTDTTGNFMSDVAVTSGTGLSVSHSAGESSTATFAGIDATNSVKGVASFASANFGVSSGAVSISAIDGGTY